MRHFVAAIVAVPLLLPLPARAEAGGAADMPPAVPAQVKEEAKAPELWVGHQVVVGERKVPLIGRVATRTDSYFLAKVQRDEGRIRVEMQTCKSDIAEAAGVQVSFPPGVEPKLPVAVAEYRERDGSWQASFESGWGREDVDGDGKPGATMRIDAPLCSGTIQVASRSRTRHRGRLGDEGLSGEVQAISEQKTLDADNACLRMMAKDESDRVRGHFVWAKASAGATCATLNVAPWPVRAEEPRAR